MKKALFNFVTGDVTYNKGQIYNDEEVAHLDPTNFEDTDGAVTPAAKTTEEIAAEKDKEIVGDIDSTEGDDKKKETGAAGSETSLDENKGDVTTGPVVHEGIKVA